MPKPFKPIRACLLPPDAELVDVAGKPHVRTRERGKSALYPLTKDGRNYLRPSKCWYFKCRDGSGTIRRVKGFADLKATEQLAAERERQASRVHRSGGRARPPTARRPPEGLRRRPRSEGRHRGSRPPDHRPHFRAAFRCGFAFPRDADAGKAAEWLNALRRDAAPAALPAGDSFTPAEAAKWLGVSGTAVRSAVKRLNMTATGNGKARTLPRSTLEALVTNRGKGCGPETANHYTAPSGGSSAGS